MARVKFREIKMSRANQARLDVINGIIREYQAEGYVLTLRQLYYQLVSRDVIPNKQSEYSKLSTLLKEAIMWLGMDLKRLNEPNPYPDSYDPSNANIEPAADGLKL